MWSMSVISLIADLYLVNQYAILLMLKLQAAERWNFLSYYNEIQTIAYLFVCTWDLTQ